MRARALVYPAWRASTTSKLRASSCACPLASVTTTLASAGPARSSNARTSAPRKRLALVIDDDDDDRERGRQVDRDVVDAHARARPHGDRRVAELPARTAESRARSPTSARRRPAPPRARRSARLSSLSIDSAAPSCKNVSDACAMGFPSTVDSTRPANSAPTLLASSTAVALGKRNGGAGRARFFAAVCDREIRSGGRVRDDGSPMARDPHNAAIAIASATIAIDDDDAFHW